MAKVREATKQTILDRTDIVDVISEYLRLQQAGSRYKGLCPFHKEKTPSFIVSPDRQMFHCFGCGVGGDVIKFVQLQESLDFVGALEFLGRRVGIHLEWDSGDSADRQKIVRHEQILQQALDFFVERLNKETSPRVKDFLNRRGLDAETIRLFQIGYCDPSWDGLVQAFRRRQVEGQVLVDVGLASQGRGGAGNCIDLFRDRIIFPIHTVSGQVVGFGGRTLGDNHPKYLNSPERGKFKKGRLLYALHLARKAITEKRDALLAEGYMDVIALHRRGFTHSVGSLGTALTAEQAQLLKRYADRCFVVYDGDAAGQKAALRALDIFRDVDLPCRVVALPEGVDPDDFLSEQGAEAFQALIDQAPDSFDYRLEVVSQRQDLNTAEGRRAVARSMGEWVLGVSSAVIRAGYWEKLADYLKVPQSVLMEEVDAVRKSSRRKTRLESGGSSPGTGSRGLQRPTQEQLAKQGLLALVLDDTTYLGPLVEFWSSNDGDRQNRDAWDQMLDRIVDWTGKQKNRQVEALKRHLEEQGESELLSRVLVGEPVPGNHQKAFEDYCQQIKYHRLQRQIAEQLRLLKDSGAQGDASQSENSADKAFRLEKERYGLGVNR